MKKLLTIITIIILLINGCTNQSRQSDLNINMDSKQAEWKVDSTILLKVASTLDEKQVGLMGVEELAADQGMIFIYSNESVLSYWMANCLIDLDILYVNKNGKVETIHTMSKEPPRKIGERTSDYYKRLKSYSSKVPVQYAIELRAGRVQELGIKVGDVININYLKQ